MKRIPLCNPYLWENPKVLLSTGFLWHVHKEGPCASEITNTIFLWFFAAFALGSIATVVLRDSMTLIALLGVAAVVNLPSFWALVQIRRTCEGFQGKGEDEDEEDEKKPTEGDAYDVNQEATEQRKELRRKINKITGTGSDKAAAYYEVIGMGAGSARSGTPPTAPNPFMNVLIDEIKYNPKRAEALSINDPAMRVTLDDFFRTEFNADPTDVFGRTQSQRQFVAMPSTSIPNDVDSYQNWLYKLPGKTCKEGGREACFPQGDCCIPGLLNSSG